MTDGRDAILLVAGVGLLAFAWWQSSSSSSDAGANGGGVSVSINPQTIAQIVASYGDAITQAVSAYPAPGLDAPTVAGVIAKESAGDPNAVGDGGAAHGLMQMHQGAASDVGFDWNALFDPTTAILAGTAYLAQQLQRFGGDMQRALVAYNQGPGVASNGPSDPRYATGLAYAQAVLSYAAQAAQAFANFVTNPMGNLPADFNPFGGATT